MCFWMPVNLDHDCYVAVVMVLVVLWWEMVTKRKYFLILVVAALGLDVGLLGPTFLLDARFPGSVVLRSTNGAKPCHRLQLPLD